MLAEVELDVRVELGRRKLPLADVLQITSGSVIELEKLVGEPLSIYANGRFIAEGEAVVIDEKFGVRITKLAPKQQRSKALL
jgi:flagellar motor switch protein FliN/FliY